MDDIKSVSNKRNIRIDYLKGLAMIMIVLLHSIQVVDGLPGIIRKPILLGQIGVQLFLFCSGYLVMKTHSHNKTFDLQSTIRFWRKKYIGMVVPFVVFMVIYLTVNCVYTALEVDLPYKNNTSVLAIVLNAFLLHGFFPFCLNNVVPGGWYVGTLLILYIATPFIIARIKRAKNMMLLSAIITLVSVALSLVLHHIFDVDTSNGSFFYFSFLNQFPAYLVGMSFGFGNHQTNGSPTKYILKDVALALIIVALFYFEWSFSYAVIPFLAALMFVDAYKILCVVPGLMRKTKWICKVGQNTFAIYLSHFLVVWYIPLLIEKYLHITGITLWIIILCLSAVLCIFSSYISTPLNKLTKRIEKVFIKDRRVG